MNYFDYKFLHIAMAVIYFYIIVVASYNPKKLFLKITAILASLPLLASGFFILGRFGISAKGPFPEWVWAKLAVWLTMLILPLLIMKIFPDKAKRVTFIYTLLFLVAAIFGIYKF